VGLWAHQLGEPEASSQEPGGLPVEELTTSSRNLQTCSRIRSDVRELLR
jgi:hypothetical protein